MPAVRGGSGSEQRQVCCIPLLLDHRRQPQFFKILSLEGKLIIIGIGVGAVVAVVPIAGPTYGMRLTAHRPMGSVQTVVDKVQDAVVELDIASKHVDEEFSRRRCLRRCFRHSTSSFPGLVSQLRGSYPPTTYRRRVLNFVHRPKAPRALSSPLNSGASTIISRPSRDPMTDAARADFWRMAIPLAPFVGSAVPFIAILLLGGFDDFQFVGRDASALTAFGILGTICFPFAAHYLADRQHKARTPWPVRGRPPPASSGRARSSERGPAGRLPCGRWTPGMTTPRTGGPGRQRRWASPPASSPTRIWCSGSWRNTRRGSRHGALRGGLA